MRVTYLALYSSIIVLMMMSVSSLSVNVRLSYNRTPSCLFHNVKEHCQLIWFLLPIEICDHGVVVK